MAENLDPDHPSRAIDIDGLINFRDVGGIPTADGARVRPGLVFRSAALDSISPHGMHQLQQLGVRMVVDLRSAAEVDRHGRFPYEGSGIEWVHLDAKVGPPVAEIEDRAGAEPTDSTSAMQQQILTHSDPMMMVFRFIIERGGPALAGVVQRVADIERLPMVFHCTSGKDRTGVAAAVIQLLLGVDYTRVVNDFRLSEMVIDQVYEDMRARFSEMAALPEAKLRRMAQADQIWLEHALDLAGGRTGPSLVPWLTENGVSPDAIDQLRANLLERP